MGTEQAPGPAVAAGEPPSAAGSGSGSELHLQPGSAAWQRRGSAGGEAEVVLVLEGTEPEVGTPLSGCCCDRRRRAPPGTDSKKKSPCPGLGLLYTVISTFLFSSSALLVKKTEDIHSVEISAIRCVFQVLFILPGLIYFKTGFIGPKGQRIYLVFRGLLGSSAMILMYYAVQTMPLADATVITYTNPVLTAIFACIFLKEKCTIWDIVFTVSTITGVVLIARPPFLFGSHLDDIEGSYTNHLKGTLAAVGSAVGAASTIVILRKMGKSVHFTLSIWYYAVIGLINSVIILSFMNEWTLPSCGIDRWLLILIGLLGLGGQVFIVKALQVEKAGPVAVMRTMDVVFAFIFQFLFLNRSPTWWSVGGALCVMSSAVGMGIRKWHTHSKAAKEGEI